jgi:hypothetical protein
MGTRGTYNHWDSYPSGLGDFIIKFINSLSQDEITEMKLLVEQVCCGFPYHHIMRPLVQHFNPTSHEESSSPPSSPRYTCLLTLQLIWIDRDDIHKYKDAIVPDQGRDYLELIKSGHKYIIDETDFAKDVIMCEYAWYIDFDNKEVRVDSGWEGATSVLPFSELKPGVFGGYNILGRGNVSDK